MTILFLSGCTFLAAEEPDLGSETHSGVEVAFVEGAPKDRFVIKNTSTCVLEDLTLQLDLSNSAGRLIFDTTATGAGVDVFQPFEVQEGDIKLLTGNEVSDGDTQLTLHIPNLAPGTRASFTIDVDDTLSNGELGQIRIADSEINGTVANFTVGDSKTTSAQFGDGSVARANLPACQLNQ